MGPGYTGREREDCRGATNAEGGQASARSSEERVKLSVMGGQASARSSGERAKPSVMGGQASPPSCKDVLRQC
jgi:hypothetical protein